MTALYRMHDAEPRGVFETTEQEARRVNTPQHGQGIFRSVNTFRGARRIENLERINAWAVDMDEGTKAEQRKRIFAGPLVPSRVVETKRGHQVYWNAKDAKPEHWNAIVLERLVPHYGADKNARDIARILREPGYLHLKDPANPFRVEVIFESECSYWERDIAQTIKPAKNQETARQVHEKVARALKVHGDGFWERVFNLDCEAALTRLSGHHAVNGEQFTFRKTARGSRNIYVNGKGTSCWVDGDGRIGSLAHGGPTIYQWLAWYGNSPRQCVEIIKREFPETEAA